MIPCGRRVLTSSVQLRENPRKPPVFEPGISLWQVWRARLSCQTGSDAHENAHRAELGPSAPSELAGRDVRELVEVKEQRLAEQDGRRVVVLLGAALRLRDDSVDHAELEAVRGVRLEGRRGLLRL